MRVETTRGFDKQYAKLQPKVKQQFQERLHIFTSTPFDQRLRNHALMGRYKGYRSIDVNGDVRALYTVKEGSFVLFSVIGTHSQLY